MIDTYTRKYIQPFIEKIANILIKLKFTPNKITFISLIIGVLSGFFIIFELFLLSLVLLWLSGLFDVLDGTVARKTNKTSSLGTLLDITFDRVVEISIIIGFAFLKPEARLSLIFLLSSIIISMTIFLTTAAFAENKGVKSFHYQAGLAERTEGFIFFSLMMIFNNIVGIISLIFTLFITITIFQRLYEAYKLLTKR